MRTFLFSSLTVLAVALSSSAVVVAQSASCRVTPSRGATQPGGTVANAAMRNTGASCVLPMYFLPVEKANPATSGTITKPPSHGTDAFVPPAAVYTPARGFTGQDEFHVEAWAPDRSGQPRRLFIRVNVTVEAAP